MVGPHFQQDLCHHTLKSYVFLCLNRKQKSPLSQLPGETKIEVPESLDHFHQELDSHSKAMGYTNITIIQPFSLMFTEEKLGRILPNKVQTYDESYGEYVSVKMFQMWRYLKTSRI